MSGVDAPSPAGSRRAAGRTRPAAPAALIGLMIVALSGAMLALAGTTPRGIGSPVEPPARVELDSRAFICDAQMPGAEVRRGIAGRRLGPTAARQAPVRVVVEGDPARESFASEQSVRPRWHAWQPCPEAGSRWWFTGAGGAAITHHTTLVVTNPREGAATVDITAVSSRGPVRAPQMQGITIAGGETEEYDLAELAPTVGEVAVSVVAARGLITVAAVDELSPGAIGKQLRDWLPATTTPAMETVIAGLPPEPSAARLLVANPGEVEAVVKVEAIGSGGTFAPDAVKPVRVAPQRVASIPLRGAFDGKPVALRVSSSSPVVAGARLSYGGDIAYAPGVRALRGVTAVAVPDLPERGPRRDRFRLLTLSSLGEAGSARITAFDRRGRQLFAREVKVAAEVSVGVRLGPEVVAIRLESDAPHLAGGLAVGADRSLALAGITPANRTIRLPDVRVAW